MRAITFNLLGAGDGAEDDFGKAALGERSVSDSTDDLQAMFDNS